jgi:hypothetical protein
MSQKLQWILLAMASVLFLSACQSAPTPADEPKTLPTPLLPTESPATPSALPKTTNTAAPLATATAVPTPIPSPPAEAQGNADVLFVRAVQTAGSSGGTEQGSTWTFHVTVQHPDTGWADYADGWDVLISEGVVIKPDPDSPFTRLLLHPHENEQPFTRSQSGIVIPPGETQVRVRAHDLVDGFGGREVIVDLTTPAGEDYEVEALP